LKILYEEFELIHGSDFEFAEVRLVSAVVAVGKILGLGGFQVSQDLIGLDTGREMLVEFKALLILHRADHSVIICALDEHSFVWDTGEFVIDLRIGLKILCNRRIRT
jgi:hypothetical protein